MHIFPDEFRINSIKQPKILLHGKLQKIEME
jgi:hypothetical protein